jgi:nitroreductase
MGLPCPADLSKAKDVGPSRKEKHLIMKMEKTAETQAPIHELIRRRWSPRAFLELPVEPDKLLTLFEAARWAASASNEQPWAFLVATQEDAKNYEDMLGVLVDFNRSWANKAPVLILTFAHTVFEKDGRPNRHAFYDLGQAAAHLGLQATALGLTTHQMAGFNVEAARERFAVPKGWEPVSVIALGYAGDPDSLTEKLREREIAPRQRKPLETFVFSGAWGHPAPIASSA